MAGISIPTDSYSEEAAVFAVNTYNSAKNVQLEFEAVLLAWRLTETDEDYIILQARDADGFSKTYAVHLDADGLRTFGNIFDTAPLLFTETEGCIIPQGRDHGYSETYEPNVLLGAGGVMTKVENTIQTALPPQAGSENEKSGCINLVGRYLRGYHYKRSVRQYHSTLSNGDDSETCTIERHEEDGSASVTITATRGSASVTTAARAFDRMKLLK